MPSDLARPVRRWLYLLAFLIGLMVIVGGYVRLTRSGLAIVEWNVITGVLPPIGESAWQAEFAKYQATPEYQKVNAGMTLGQYQRIFYVEWVHRIVARAIGLVVLLPLLWFWWRRKLGARKGRVYLGILALFAFQGFLGWFMVASGLVDRPAVSHFRLTTHLLAALALLALCLWQALELRPAPPPPPRLAGRPGPRALAAALLGVVLLQVAYGGMVAGLKAGHVSDTWPLMFGRLLPDQLLTAIQPWWSNLFHTPATIHFVHRWLAFLVLAIAVWVHTRARGAANGKALRRGTLTLVWIVVAQLLLGITTVVLGVPIAVALAHQGLGVLLFAMTVVVVHELGRGAVAAAPPPLIAPN